MAGLMDLPNEIIHLILSYIISDEPNVYPLRQVNHHFNSHISRLFFENITIPYEAYSPFPTFLKSAIFSPENENVGYIRRLSIKPFILDSESRCRYLNSLGSRVEDLDIAREEFKADMKKDIAGLIGRLQPNQLVGFECTIHQLVDYQALLDTQRSLQHLLVNPVELAAHTISNPNSFLPCLQNLHLEGFRPSHETQYQLLARIIIQPYASKLRVLSIDMTEDTRDGSPSIYLSKAILETCKGQLKATLGADIPESQVIPLEFPQLEELSIQEIAVEVRLDELFLGNNIPNWPRLPNLQLLRVLKPDTEPESESDTPPEPPMHPSDAIKILWTQRLEQTFCKITDFPTEFWLIHGIYKKPVYSGPTGPRVEVFKSWIGEGGEVVIKAMSFRDARRRFPESLILGTERDQAMWEAPVRG
ncbi:hypothetical protein TWF225_006605 [Orbilia oligospora]|nr:hypothetical protein TWF225_006605 [Orbilia oligospora]KAF3265120.1 hypothetical protein TWF217_002770 [Orbilia oligospora]KAF3268008.1 hypothetical protein TWF128_008022 [Orbilia oligospora]